MEFSTELLARMLYYVPQSPAKVAMQGVSTSFRQALQTRQAHAIAAQITFPLEDADPLRIPRAILRVMPFVSLGPKQQDFSWVGFLDHVQVLACKYEALRPNSPLQTVRELILDCVGHYNTFHHYIPQCRHNKKISLAHLFPNVTRLRLHAIPVEDGVDDEETEFEFFKDIQLMTLQLVVLYDYPEPIAPILTGNPDWACLKVNIDSVMYGNDCPDASDCIPVCTAHIITSLTLHNLNATLIDLSVFSFCSRLKDLAFGQEMTDRVEIVGIEQLPKTCCTVTFRDFIPYMHSLSNLKSWRCEWGKDQSANNLGGVCPVIVKLPEVDDEYYRLTRSEQCLEDVV